MIRRLLPFVLALSIPLMAHAQWKDPNGALLPDESWRKSQGKFGAALQIATESEFDRFEKEWHSTASSHTPSLTTTGRARRGDTVRILFVYSGCDPGDAKPARCSKMLRVRITKPDGTVYADIPDTSLAGEQPPAEGFVQLSPASIMVRFEQNDPSGRYRIRAWLHDPGSDTALELSDSIRLTDVGD